MSEDRVTSAAVRSALYQVVVRQSGRPANTVPLTAFPFVLGRSPEASLTINAPGIWPRHLALELNADEGLFVTVERGAIATLDDRSLERHRLRHGDEIRIGPVRVQFLVSPPARRSLSGWELALWLLLAVVLLAQVVVIGSLPHD